eukprot:2390879-Pleurochrysis_carterae.AAC.3
MREDDARGNARGARRPRIASPICGGPASCSSDGDSAGRAALAKRPRGLNACTRETARTRLHTWSRAWRTSRASNSGDAESSAP